MVCLVCFKIENKYNIRNRHELIYTTMDTHLQIFTTIHTHLQNFTTMHTHLQIFTATIHTDTQTHHTYHTLTCFSPLLNDLTQWSASTCLHAQHLYSTLCFYVSRQHASQHYYMQQSMLVNAPREKPTFFVFICSMNQLSLFVQLISINN